MNACPSVLVSARRSRNAIRFALSSLLFVWSIASAIAQSAVSGTITGRIFNPATQEYVHNAEVRVAGTDLVTYSGDDGSYALTNVPPGEVTLTVTYTGYDTATARVNAAGGAATQNFELQGSTYRGAKKGEEIVKLDSFVVSSEREGNAKAIMDQRAALNFKHVVATDNFGEVTSGNVGEFVKYMPGVVIDYTQSDARAARIGGLDPKYVGISLDGMRMANAASGSFNSGSRGFEFEQASINSIEAIEVNKTLTASMDADAPAGSINLRSKSAFERKGREVVVDVNVAANTYAFYLHKSPGPDDGMHYKVFPGFKASYAESFGGRLGVQLNALTNIIYTEQENGTTNYDFSNAARGPIITSLSFRTGPKITRRDAFGANFDYKLSDRWVFALRTAGSHLNDEYINRTISFNAAAAQIDPSSTLTKVIAQPAPNNINTRLEESQGHRNRLNDTVTYTPRLTYKFGDIVANAGGGYSRSRTHYADIHNGFFNNVIARITRTSWMAERDATNQPGWRMTQLSGRSWSDPASLGRDDDNANNIRSREMSGQNQVFMGYVDGKKTFNVAGLPVSVMTGAKVRLTTHDVEWDNSAQWTYVGPNGRQTDPATVFPVYQRVGFDPKIGGNMGALNLPYVDGTKLQGVWLEHPNWFTPDTLTNFRTSFTAPRGIKEQVDAGFVETSTRWQRLRLNLGIRRERTRTVGKVFDILPSARVTAMGYTPNTIPFIIAQYRNGERAKQYGEYSNWFTSGGAKYEITRNLVVQVSGAQSILRPNYDNLAGVVSVDDTNRIVSVPNPQLKPEFSNKYFASVQYYLEPAGNLALSVYQLNVKNMGTVRVPTTAEAAGYGDDPAYAGYTFSQLANASGTQKMKGVDFEYSQQLVFLPDWWRGFSVFGSVSRTVAPQPLVNVVPKSANGGIRYNHPRFNIQLRATWSAARIDSLATNEIRWQTERLLADLSAGYKINRNYELTLSGRNINNAFQDYYSNQPGLLRSREILGPVWTLGVRGRF